MEREHCARGVLRQPLAEAVGRPVGPKAHLDLPHLAAAEVPHDPLVGMERAVLEQARERIGAARLELDEAADAVVHAEARRLPVVGRTPVELGSEPPRLGERRRPIHLEVELDDGEGTREVDYRERRAGDRGRGEQHPEDRPSGHGLLRQA